MYLVPQQNFCLPESHINHDQFKSIIDREPEFEVFVYNKYNRVQHNGITPNLRFSIIWGYKYIEYYASNLP